MLGAGIRGRVAAVKWSYYTAAAIEGYSVIRKPKPSRDWSLSGNLVPGRIDDYKLAQRPLYFVAPFKGGAWRWEIKTWRRDETGRLQAELGPMSIEDKHGLSRKTT